MGWFPNTDQAMIEHSRLDHVGRWLLTIGQLCSQIGAKLVENRNELLTAALDDAHAEVERAYELGRLHEREGVHVDEDQGQGDEDQGDDGQGAAVLEADWTREE